MSDLEKAQVYAALARATRAYREATEEAALRLNSPNLLRRVEALFEDEKLCADTAKGFERKARGPGRVLPFKRPASRVTAAVEAADWMGR